MGVPAVLLMKHSSYSSEPAAFLEEEKGRGKINSFQRLGTKSLSCCFHTWESTVSSLSGPSGCLTSQRAGCRELAITDPGVLKQAVQGSKYCCAWKSESSNTGGSIFFSNDSFCLSAALSQRLEIYNCLWTCLPAPGKERGRPEKVSRTQVTEGTLFPHAFQHISGFSIPYVRVQLPPVPHLPLSGFGETQHWGLPPIFFLIP